MKHLISMDLADSDNFALAVEVTNQCKKDDELIIVISPRHSNYERTAFVIDNEKVTYEEYIDGEIIKKHDNISNIKEFFSCQRLWRKPGEIKGQDRDSKLHSQAMLADVARLLEKTSINPNQVQLVIGASITDAVSDTIIAPEYAFMTIDESNCYRLRTPNEFIQYKKDMLSEHTTTRSILRRTEAERKIEYLKNKCKFSDCVINLQDNPEAITSINLTSEEITIYAAGPLTFLAEIAKKNLLPTNSNIIFKGMMFTRNTKENIFGDNFNLIVDPLAAEIVISQLFPKCLTIQCFPTDIYKGSNINWSSFQKSQLEKISCDSKFAKQYGLTNQIADMILLYNIGTGNNKLNSPIGSDSEVLTKPVFDLALVMPISEEETSKVNIKVVDNSEVYGGKRFEVIDDESGDSKIQMVRVDKLKLDITKPGAILDLLVKPQLFLNKTWMRKLYQPQLNQTEHIESTGIKPYNSSI